MSSDPNWTGTLTRLRFDPAGAGNGSFSVDYVYIGGESATPTSTPTATKTATATNTVTTTSTVTLTNTPSPYPTGTMTQTATATATFTVTPTPTSTPTTTPTETGTPTETVTPSPTDTMTKTETPTQTATLAQTATPTPYPTGTMSETPTKTLTPTPTNTASPTGTTTPTPTKTLTSTVTPTLPSFSGAFYVYDGDGKMVKGTLNGTTTYYASRSYQVTNGVVTKYYGSYAMRVGPTLYYLLSDHLGSASVTLNASGGLVSELRYKAFGKTRYAFNQTPSDYRYTGQLQQADIGLYYYGARWYDPALARFISPDSIVPGAGSARAYDRYAYGLNNPISNTDPSGHWPELNDIGAYISGAALQYFDDMSFGAVSKFTTLNVNQNEAFQEGRTLGRDLSNTVAKYEFVTGAAALGAALNSMGATGGGTLACAAATEGACAVPGGIALAGEAVLGLGGIVSGLHGAAMMAKINGDPLPSRSSAGSDKTGDVVTSQESEITVLGYSEDVRAYTGVNTNILVDQPNWSWEGMNAPFLDKAIERGDIFVYVSDYAEYEGRVFHREIAYLAEKGYENIIDLLHPR